MGMMKMNVRYLLAVALAVIPSALLAEKEPVNIYLTCKGSGERTVTNKGGALTGTVGGIGGHRIGESGSASVGSMTSKAGFSEQLDISVVQTKAKARVPRRFLPFLNNNRDGWVRITNLKIGKDEITGNMDIGLLDHPKLRIDRLAGSVAMDGKVGSFYGQCQMLNPDKPAF